MPHRIPCTIVVVLCFCAIPFPKFLVAAQAIPHVTGRLVDAMSGKPMEAWGLRFEEWPEEEQSTKPPAWKPDYTDHRQATVTVESRPDGKVLRYSESQYNSFFWHSGDRHVEVFFYYPIPQEERFVSYYLTKFPSNFQ
jgi:hypothetical protein